MSLGIKKVLRCTCGRSPKSRTNGSHKGLKSCRDNPNQRRRSTCPCFTSPRGSSCGKQCRCVNCGNPFNKIKRQHASPIKKKRNVLAAKKSSVLKRVSGTAFLSQNNIAILPGKWTDLETITLLVISEFITKACKEESVSEFAVILSGWLVRHLLHLLDLF